MARKGGHIAQPLRLHRVSASPSGKPIAYVIDGPLIPINAEILQVASGERDSLEQILPNASDRQSESANHHPHSRFTDTSGITHGIHCLSLTKLLYCPFLSSFALSSNPPLHPLLYLVSVVLGVADPFEFNIQPKYIRSAPPLPPLYNSLTNGDN